MIKAELTCGFKAELDENVMNNMEMVDALAEMKDDDPIALSKICRMLYGDKQRKALYDHLKTSDGRVPIEEVSAAIKDTFSAMGDKEKKS